MLSAFGSRVIRIYFLGTLYSMSLSGWFDSKTSVWTNASINISGNIIIYQSNYLSNGMLSLNPSSRDLLVTSFPIASGLSVLVPALDIHIGPNVK